MPNQSAAVEAKPKRKPRKSEESKLDQEYGSTKDAARVMGLSIRALHALRKDHPTKFKVMQIPGVKRLYWHLPSLRAALQPAVVKANGHQGSPV